MAKTKGKSQKGKAPPVGKTATPSGAAPAAAKTAAKAAAAKPTGKVAAKLVAKPAAKPAAPPKPKLPLVAVKPKKASRPSLPLPPPPPRDETPPPRDELSAPRDVARLTRYGERFGPHKIDVRWLPIQLPVNGTHLAVVDPGAPKSFRAFDRPVGAGQFRAMLSIARSDDGKERLSALVVHVGRPPIARWSVAHFRGQKKPKSADELPRCPVTTKWIALIDAGKDGKDSPGAVAVPTGAAPFTPIQIPLTDGRKALALPCPDGEYAAYWAIDATDKPICLVLDFDVFSLKEWKARPPQ